MITRAKDSLQFHLLFEVLIVGNGFCLVMTGWESIEYAHNWFEILNPNTQESNRTADFTAMPMLTNGRLPIVVRLLREDLRALTRLRGHQLVLL